MPAPAKSYQRVFSFLPWVRRNRDQALILVCGIVLTVLIAFLYLLQPLLLSTLDLKLYDTLLKSRTGRTPSGNIVIVDIDTKSLEQFGQWPWPRYRLARLLDRLREMGALTVGIDILFAEPDRTSLRNIQKNIAADFDLSVDLSRIPRRYVDNDALLAETLRKGPYVLGYQFSFDGSASRECTLHPVNVVILKEESVPDTENGVFRPSSVDCLYQPFAAAVSASGYFNIKPDHDGIIRRVPLLMEYDNQFFSHLSLSVLLSAFRPEQMVLTVGRTATERLSIDGAEIPLMQKGSFLIPFSGPRGTYRHISAADILGGTVGRQEIEGHIVLVGAAAAGLLDVRATPADPAMPGVEVNANIIDAIMQGDFLARPRTAAAYEFAGVMLFGLISTVLFARCRAVVNFAVLIFLMSFALALTVILFRNGTYISPLYPALTSAVNFSFLSLLDFWRAERRLKEKTGQQLVTQEAMLETIANMTETRDPETGGHIRRTQKYVRVLAEHIRNSPPFAGMVTDEYIDHLVRSAPLHDLGKVGVPDHILLKPGSLTAEEFEEIKKHTLYGKKVIDAAEDKLGDSSFLAFAGEMAVSHHERWDGLGYPRGLKGEAIPLAGRILAVADVYDALISGRPYKTALSHEKAVEIILAGRGTQFDPVLVDVFGKVHPIFRAIAEEYTDARFHRIP